MRFGRRVSVRVELAQVFRTTLGGPETLELGDRREPNLFGFRDRSQVAYDIERGTVKWSKKFDVEKRR